MLGTEMTTNPAGARLRSSSTSTRSGSTRCSSTSPYTMTSKGPSPTGISRSRFKVITRSQWRAPACASTGSPSIAVTRQPRSVSWRLSKPSAAPTSSSRRPRPSPSQRRITEWLLCRSGLRTYRGDVPLITQSSDGRPSISNIGIEPAPTGFGDRVDRGPRQGAHHAPRRVDRRDQKYAAGARPGLLEPRRVPEDVARLGKAGAEREIRLKAVHDVDRRLHDQEQRRAALDRPLVHDEVARLEPTHKRRRQRTHGANPSQLRPRVRRDRRQKGDRRRQRDPDAERRRTPPGS